MASLTTPQTTILTPAPTRGQVRWPATPRWRNSARAALAAPYVALAVISHHHHYRSTPNAGLQRAAHAIRWGSGDLSFIGHVSPPLPVALAGLLPGLLSLSITGALAAGVILEAIGARLLKSRIPPAVVLLLTLGFGCTPSFAYTATTDLRSFIALTLLAVAIDGFLRFALKADTHGGFQAGLTLGLASLCDPVAIVCAIGFTAAAPLIARSRFRGQPGIGRATAAVLLFPTLAGTTGWTFLCWRFSGHALSWLRTEEPSFGFSHGTTHQLVAALHSLEQPLLLTPLYVLAFTLLAVRRHLTTAAAITLPLVSAVLAQWIGIQFTTLWLAILLGIVGIVSLPRKPDTPTRVLIIIAAIAGPALKWTYLANPAVLTWQHSIAR